MNPVAVLGYVAESDDFRFHDGRHLGQRAPRLFVGMVCDLLVDQIGNSKRKPALRRTDE